MFSFRADGHATGAPLVAQDIPDTKVCPVKLERLLNAKWNNDYAVQARYHLYS